MAKCGVLMMFILGLISVGLIVACVSGNDWASSLFNNKPVRVGLWKRCTGHPGEDECVVLGDNVESWTQVVRALAVLTCLFSAIGTVLTLLLLIAKNLPSRYITWFFLCAAFAMSSSLVVFIIKIPTADAASENTKIGWCYIVGWVGVIFDLATFLFGFCADKF
uniref:Uncharacterized protein n=1 Tax=Clytia hemisphaerica TaxID=252671 RepID=A0A7M5V1Z3_9CNID